MRTSINSADTYRKLISLNFMNKYAEDMLSEYTPDRSQVAEQIYDDVEQQGYRDNPSPAIQDMMMQYPPEYQDQAAAAPVQEAPMAAPMAAPEENYSTESDYFSDLTPSEYLSLLNAMDQSGMGMSFGASNFYDDVYDPMYKMGSEKYASLMNEINKIGRLNHTIKEMAKEPGKEKIASELNAINKDYFCDVLSELVGTDNILKEYRD